MSKQAGLLLIIAFFVFGLLGADAVWAAKKKKSPEASKEKTAVADPTSNSITRPPTLPPSLPPKVPDVVEIQRELQKILQVQRSLQYQHYNQIREIERITVQARAHQKLLETLETSRAARPETRDLDELLRREKIRLIDEETKKNRAALEEIQKKGTEKNAKP